MHTGCLKKAIKGLWEKNLRNSKILFDRVFLPVCIYSKISALKLNFYSKLVNFLKIILAEIYWLTPEVYLIVQNYSL